MEMTILRLSEASETINALEPDSPPIPVAYPKETRRRQ